MDIVNPETRSRMMAGIRNKNTKPELLIRKKLFALGFRYRINSRNVLGKPDIILKKYRAVIFIHGCFWHGHECRLFKWPSQQCFLTDKINKNIDRDAMILNTLRSEGWRICIIWECAIRGKRQIERLDETIELVANWIKSESIWLEISG